MRKITFQQDEYYHIYNRGVDKRNIIGDKEDLQRFIFSMQEFSTTEPHGWIYLSDNKKSLHSPSEKIVQIIAYCINQNHFHFLIKPLCDNGIQQFMHRLSTGYTKYFNGKYDRSGSLFQGPYKAIHIETNEYLLHLSMYINLNDLVHQGMNELWFAEYSFSSLKEYSGEKKNLLCDASVILDQFQSKKLYVDHARVVLEQILIRKESEKYLRAMLLEEK